MGTDAAPRAKALIDLPKAKATGPSAGLAAAIADARARGESYLVAIDVAALGFRFDPDAKGPAPAGIEPGVMAIGTDAGALTMRVTVPAAQIKAVAQH